MNNGIDTELTKIRNLTNLAIAAASHEGVRNIPINYREKLPFFPRDQLKLDAPLGNGNFGEVIKNGMYCLIYGFQYILSALHQRTSFLIYAGDATLEGDMHVIGYTIRHGSGNLLSNALALSWF